MRLTKRLVIFIAFAVILLICKTSGEPALLVLVSPLAVAFLLIVATGLWIATKSLWLAWWRGGWVADAAAAFSIVAVIGCVWPQTGIWDNAAGRWLFGVTTEARQATTAAPQAPPIGTVSKGFEFEGGDPSQWASWRPVTSEARNAVIVEARKAIAAGAPRASVIERVRKLGLDPSGL